MPILAFKYTLRIIGSTFLASIPFLWWFIHGDYERYLWIINGPFPFSHMGSAPFQLLIFVSLFIAGTLLILISFFRTPSPK